MAIPDMQVTAIRSQGRQAWTVVTVEFQWLNGVYCGDGQWPDAVAAAALAMESEEWRACWSRPHFVERELLAADRCAWWPRSNRRAPRRSQAGP